MHLSRSLRRLAGFFHARVPELKLWQVRDPRHRQGRRWQLEQLLCAILAGLMAGARNLCEVEELTENLGSGIRCMLNIPRRIADTTLRDVACRLGVESLRTLLHRAVRAAHRRKGLPPVELPFHVVAMDGKGTALTSWDSPYAQRHVPEYGKPYGLLRTVTSTLATARGRPCIDVCPIPAHTNEMGQFQGAFQDLLDAHGNLFRMVSYDAGAVGEENARAVVDAGKDYLFHMANEERHMTQISEELLATTNVIAKTEDVLDNQTMVVRKLHLMRVYDNSWAPHKSFIWSHTKTILRVDSETWKTDSDIAPRLESSESRVYCSSLATDKLFPAQWLLLVRLHWQVELSHQTFDTAFAEDHRPWIINDPNGTLAILMLRRIAYTLLTLFRSVTLRSDENHNMPWQRLMRWVYRTLIASTTATVQGLRCRSVPIITD